MPEILDDHRVDDVFAQFRTEARTEIEPPGSAAARRTVSRRRTTRAVAVGALAIAVLAGAGVLAGLVHSGHGTQPADPTTVPSSTAPTSPSDARALQALAELGYAPASAGRADLLPIRTGVFYGTVTGDADRSVLMAGPPGDPLPAGRYLLRVTCVGPGAITVGWRIPGSTVGGAIRATCVDGPEPGWVNLPTGEVQLTIGAPKNTPSPIGWAIEATDPRIVAARNAMGEATSQELVGGDAVLNVSTGGTDSTVHPAGRYKLLLGCAGGGPVKVTFTGGEVHASKNVYCPSGGAATQLSITTTRPGVELSFVLEPVGIPASAIAYAWAIFAA
jgi:hypothetical protein